MSQSIYDKIINHYITRHILMPKYTKYLTIAFAIVEAVGLYFNYKAYMLPSMMSGANQIVGIILFIIIKGDELNEKNYFK